MNVSIEQIRTEQSIITLANASELVRQVVSSIIGNDISDSINGSRLTGAAICALSQSIFTDSLKPL